METMSTSSLNSSMSDGMPAFRFSGLRQSSNLIVDENFHFDKCPCCEVLYDYLKRNNGLISKVPLILTCKHTVCEDCIRKLWRAGHVTCPICNEKIPMTRAQYEKPTDVFQPHFALIGYLMWNKNNFTNKKINLVPTGVTLKHKQGCNEMDIDAELSSGDSVFLNCDQLTTPIEFEKCVIHQDSFINIHCESCGNSVCCYCFVENHMGHKAVYLYKLDAEEIRELEQITLKADVVLKHLEISWKKARNLKTYNHTQVETEIRNYFFNLHAKLHLAERNLLDELSSFKLRKNESGHLINSLKLSILKVRHLLNTLRSVNNKNINIRALFEEARNIENIPCRLLAEGGTGEPVQFVIKTGFENVDEIFSLAKLSDVDYSIVPIDDWPTVANISPVEKSTIQECPPEAVQSTSSRFEKSPRIVHQKEDIQKVVVTHLNDLNSFFVQKSSSLNTLKSLQRKMSKNSKHEFSDYEISLGGLYSVLFVSKNLTHWRRGKVKKIDNRADETLYNVFFIDYGNTQYVNKDKITKLDVYSSRNSPLARECRLTNCDGITLTEKGTVQLAQIVNHEVYMKHISTGPNAVQEVELFVMNSNNEFTSVRDILLESEKNISYKPEQEPKNPMKLFKNTKSFTICQEEEVFVTYVKNPFHVCVQLAQYDKVLERMRTEMRAFYETKYCSCVPIVGTNVVVRYVHMIQGNWHRAKVLTVLSANKQVEVYFVDWGGTAIVPWSSIKILTENFTKIECQAITVKLAHIAPIDDSWTRDVEVFLNDMVSKCNTFKMAVSNVDPLEVALFQTSTDGDVCVNALLVAKNFATSTGNISKTVCWPINKVTEVVTADDDGDDLSTQLIKKSEEILQDYDDPELKDGLKQQIEILRFESPDLIHIKFVIHKEKELEMYKCLQIHYSSKQLTQPTWGLSENCVVFDNRQKIYCRGVIKSAAGRDVYIVYLVDDARDLKVNRKNIFVYDKYFTQFPCFTYKCCLAGVKPAGDSGKWSQLAIEIMQKIFKTYKTVCLKKVDTDFRLKLLKARMWYSLTIQGNALEPAKKRLIPIHKALLESGVAFSAPIGVIDTPPQPMDIADTEMDAVSKHLDEVEIGAAKPPDEEAKKTDWYDLVLQDEASISSATLDNWPEPDPLQLTEFNATLKCIDYECNFLIREKDVEAMYLEMEEHILKKFSSSEFPFHKGPWHAGEMCMISYDKKFYRGTVMEVNSLKEIYVEMIDFGSFHMVKNKQLSKHLMYPDVPPFLNKVQLYDVLPKCGEWDPNDIDTLLSLVTDDIFVKVKSSLEIDVPLVEVFLANGTNLNNLIVEKCSDTLTRLRNDNVTLNVNYEESCTDNMAVDSSSCDELVSFTYAPLPALSTNKKTMMFVVNMLKYDLVVLNKSNVTNNAKEWINVRENIHSEAERQPLLENINLNDPCICPHPKNKLWSRAMIYNIDSINYGYVVAFFVDYGNLEIVTTKNLRVMKPNWFELPVYNRIALVNIELMESKQADYFLMQMNRLCDKAVEVEVMNEDPLTVHLYEDGELVYQNMIDCGFLKLR